MPPPGVETAGSRRTSYACGKSATPTDNSPKWVRYPCLGGLRVFIMSATGFLTTRLPAAWGLARAAAIGYASGCLRFGGQSAGDRREVTGWQASAAPATARETIVAWRCDGECGGSTHGRDAGRRAGARRLGADQPNRRPNYVVTSSPSRTATLLRLPKANSPARLTTTYRPVATHNPAAGPVTAPPVANAAPIVTAGDAVTSKASVDRPGRRSISRLSSAPAPSKSRRRRTPALSRRARLLVSRSTMTPRRTRRQRRPWPQPLQARSPTPARSRPAAMRW